ncbi:hypothetical protein L249_2140 [Ophiocordyceps polyrhachis-furcata BCC 54312]|uniref:MYND-type domain-containing protein n=1 Tax=Ophiocordyceps polyrhachis-furcata BCC 54312 TaxID=1330021 RepID=A0A367LPD3_9HYPO|nr:hypothetical protein L249_2140 [Ophiocordyceps polyrhachis-furcata BCC 54312]
MEDREARLEQLLDRRAQLSQGLASLPYDLMLYLERAAVHSHLGYPDLAAGDAYRALLLADEVANDAFEYHHQALEALHMRAGVHVPEVLNHGNLSSLLTPATVDCGDAEARRLAVVGSIRAYQILSLSLLLCGCLKSAYGFCIRGLDLAPENRELINTKAHIQTVARRKLRRDDVDDLHLLPDNGLVRREVYPWNDFEPDRFSPESLASLNAQLREMAPKCVVQVATLPVLLEGESETDSHDIIPTCQQLGLFARDDIAPGEPVLEEYSLLTANNRLQDPACDACGAELPPLGGEEKKSPVRCQDCHDVVFCSSYCHDEAQRCYHPAVCEKDKSPVRCQDCHDVVFCSSYCHDEAQRCYHPAVCEKDVGSIAKDPAASEADDALYLLLLARVLALAAHQAVNPLELPQVKFLWGDFVPPRSNDIDSAPNAGPPPEWTLPFSFKYNIEAPLHLLEKMDVDIFASLAEYEGWIVNTVYAKFRGTASARKNARDGRPDVAAVHPYWCLANHDCDPNVTWDWGGRMTLYARKGRVNFHGEDGEDGEDGDDSAAVRKKNPPGIKRGDEILNHYCDVSLPVQQRREWALGSLGGWCMCRRCRTEAAAGK